MNFYHKQENVNLYKEMTKDYDSGAIINKVKDFLPPDSTLLELGMGFGNDLLALSQYYQVTGSDFSPIFLDEFRRSYPEIEVLELNAADFSLNPKFDCIYSNKVLYHLSVDEFRKSLQLQAEHLNDDGILIMTMWYGRHREEFYEDGLRFVYYTEKEITEQIPVCLRIETIERYTEDEQDDSLLIVLRKSK